MAIDPEIEQYINDAVNGLWVFVAGIICFLLQAGFGLLEVGNVRAKNAQNIMIKNIMDACVTAMAYWAVGYGFAYGPGGNGFIGGSQWFLMGTENYCGWFFQYVFAGTTATIVSGAVAERCRFKAYLIYSLFLSAFIYPVASHWVWSDEGFLYGKVYDYAGGGAVHGLGGAAAAAGAYFLGPRIGKFTKDEATGKIITNQIPGHNMVLAATGGFLLWFGFFAFNGASVPDVVGTEFVVTGRIAVVTTLSGATGAIFLLFFGYFKTKEWDMMLALNGLLAGMIASCSGVNAFEPWVSLIVGVTGSLVYLLQNHIFENVLHIDDPLGASALHGAAGFLGMILVAIFGKPEFMGVEKELGGLLYGGDGTLLGWNLLGTVIDAVWGFGACGVIFVALNYFKAFRVSEEVEIMGMDMHHHGGHAYPDQHKLEELATTMHGTKFLSESEDAADEEQPQKQPLVERKSNSVLPDGAF